MKISWNHQDTDFSWPLSFDQKVQLFYDQTLGWQLHIADLVANGGTPLEGGGPVQPLRHSGFAVLQICLSYFELIGLIVSNSRSSKKSFQAGAKNILPWLKKSSPENKDLLDRLYLDARCGLYHPGRIRPGIGLGQPSNVAPIEIDPGTRDVCVSPELLPKTLKVHLEAFRKRLLNPDETAIRTAFERHFDGGFR